MRHRPSTARSGEGHLVLGALPTSRVTLDRSLAFLDRVDGMASHLTEDLTSNSLYFSVSCIEGATLPSSFSNLSAVGKTHHQGAPRGTIPERPEKGKTLAPSTAMITRLSDSHPASGLSYLLEYSLASFSLSCVHPLLADPKSQIFPTQIV